tara:strand:- start:341 stop:484 length:144 start_codon:yes stop_codon:yes gene_type:complete
METYPIPGLTQQELEALDTALDRGEGGWVTNLYTDGEKLDLTDQVRA